MACRPPHRVCACGAAELWGIASLPASLATQNRQVKTSIRGSPSRRRPAASASPRHAATCTCRRRLRPHSNGTRRPSLRMRMRMRIGATLIVATISSTAYSRDASSRAEFGRVFMPTDPRRSWRRRGREFREGRMRPSSRGGRPSSPPSPEMRTWLGYTAIQR